MHNENGDKVQAVDAGTDTYGILWTFFNAPNVANAGYPIIFDIEDYWRNDIMPSEMSEVGTFATLSYKFIVKGFVLKMGLLVQLHLNANCDITADAYKSMDGMSARL